MDRPRRPMNGTGRVAARPAQPVDAASYGIPRAHRSPRHLRSIGGCRLRQRSLATVDAGATIAPIRLSTPGRSDLGSGVSGRSRPRTRPQVSREGPVGNRGGTLGLGESRAGAGPRAEVPAGVPTSTPSRTPLRSLRPRALRSVSPSQPSARPNGRLVASVSARGLARISRSVGGGAA